MNSKLEKYKKFSESINQKFPAGSMNLFWQEIWNQFNDVELPWHNGTETFVAVDTHIKDLAKKQNKSMIEIGCGNNPRYTLKGVKQGLVSHALDVSPSAIELAKHNLADQAQKIQWICNDILDFDSDKKFDLVVDDACFHLFKLSNDRTRFAQKIKSLLSDNGTWISLIASGENTTPDCDGWFTDLSLQDIVAAIEPSLKITKIESAWKTLACDLPKKHYWVLFAQQRQVPAIWQRSLQP